MQSISRSEFFIKIGIEKNQNRLKILNWSITVDKYFFAMLIIKVCNIRNITTNPLLIILRKHDILFLNGVGNSS